MTKFRKEFKEITAFEDFKVLKFFKIFKFLKDFQVVIAAGFHLLPFRTEKLSLLTLMVLHNVGE